MPYPSYQGTDPDGFAAPTSTYMGGGGQYQQASPLQRYQGGRLTYGGGMGGYGGGMGGISHYNPGIHVAGNNEPGGYNFDANLRNAFEDAQLVNDMPNEIDQDQYKKSMALAALQDQAQNQPSILNLNDINVQNQLQQAQGFQQADQDAVALRSKIEQDPNLPPSQWNTATAQGIQSLASKNKNPSYQQRLGKWSDNFSTSTLLGPQPSIGVGMTGYMGSPNQGLPNLGAVTPNQGQPTGQVGQSQSPNQDPNVVGTPNAPNAQGILNSEQALASAANTPSQNVVNAPNLNSPATNPASNILPGQNNSSQGMTSAQLQPKPPTWRDQLGDKRVTPVTQQASIDPNTGQTIRAGSYDPQLAAQNQLFNKNLDGFDDALSQLQAKKVDPDTAMQMVGQMTNNGRNPVDPTALKDMIGGVDIQHKDDQADNLLDLKNQGALTLQKYKSQAQINNTQLLNLSREKIESARDAANAAKAAKGGGSSSVDSKKAAQLFDESEQAWENMIKSSDVSVGGTKVGGFDPSSFGTAFKETFANFMDMTGPFRPLTQGISTAVNGEDMNTYLSSAGDLMSALYHQLYGARVTRDEFYTKPLQGVTTSLMRNFIISPMDQPGVVTSKNNMIRNALSGMAKRGNVTLTPEEQQALTLLKQVPPPTQLGFEDKDLKGRMEDGYTPYADLGNQTIPTPNPQVQGGGVSAPVQGGSPNPVQGVPQPSVAPPVQATTTAGTNIPQIDSATKNAFRTLAGGNPKDALQLFQSSGGNYEMAQKIMADRAATQNSH